MAGDTGLEEEHLANLDAFFLVRGEVLGKDQSALPLREALLPACGQECGIRAAREGAAVLKCPDEGRGMFPKGDACSQDDAFVGEVLGEQGIDGGMHEFVVLAEAEREDELLGDFSVGFACGEFGELGEHGAELRLADLDGGAAHTRLRIGKSFRQRCLFHGGATFERPERVQACVGVLVSQGHFIQGRRG